MKISENVTRDLTQLNQISNRAMSMIPNTEPTSRLTIKNPVKFTFLLSRTSSAVRLLWFHGTNLSSIILLFQQVWRPFMMWHLVPQLELTWMIIVPHKTWEGEKTLCQGDICVLESKSSTLLVWTFPLPSIFNVEAQGCVTVVVCWYVSGETCTGISRSPNHDIIAQGERYG